MRFHQHGIVQAAMRYAALPLFYFNDRAEINTGFRYDGSRPIHAINATADISPRYPLLFVGTYLSRRDIFVEVMGVKQHFSPYWL